jgi:hypothetical protein
MPATARQSMWKWSVLMVVMIGIDPHKGSHTAGCSDRGRGAAGQGAGPCLPGQAEQLVAWAAAWPERIWAVEGAARAGPPAGPAADRTGERVLDVQPKLAARVRLLHTENTGKSDLNDALSVAVAALRSTTRREVIADDHALRAEGLGEKAP